MPRARSRSAAQAGPALVVLAACALSLTAAGCFPVEPCTCSQNDAWAGGGGGEGGGGGGADGGGEDLGPPPDTGPMRQYPSGPYGVNEGQVIANHQFLTPGGQPFSFNDLRTDGARLLLLATAAGWCTACFEEQPILEELYQNNRERGLAVLVSIFEDTQFRPANPSHARDWRDRFGLSFPVVADRDFVLRAYYDEQLTPMNMLVDLESMTILKINTGWDETFVRSFVRSYL